MTRIDEAAKTIIRCMPTRTHPECAVDAARALDADGHLLPDLPEPDMRRDDEDWRDEYADEWAGPAPDVWHIGETWVGPLGAFPGQAKVAVWDDTGEPYEPLSPYVARKMAYALLAAADYAERNQEC